MHSVCRVYSSWEDLGAHDGDLGAQVWAFQFAGNIYPYLSRGRRAVYKRRPQGFQAGEMVTMYMAQEAG